MRGTSSRSSRARDRRRAFGIAWVALCAALGALVPAARANPRPAHAAGEVDLRPPPGLRSRSLRFAWDGKLEHGMKLRESDYVRYLGENIAHDNFYATWELVQLLERGARRVAFRSPGTRLTIGELSREQGGRIGGHRSHESGRDADVGFYLTRGDGESYYTYAFAELDARGRGKPPMQYLRFDDARNWELVAKLITDGDARVQYIFVANWLRQRLLDQAMRLKAAPELIERAKAVLVQPARGNPHSSHFHVRIYCAPADQNVCKDRGPFWPWYPGTPPDGVFTPLSGAALPAEE